MLIWNGNLISLDLRKKLFREKFKAAGVRRNLVMLTSVFLRELSMQIIRIK